MEHGLVHIYTGNGKGKTTAAVGLGLRAVGNGLTVNVFQFLKSTPSGEMCASEKFEDFKFFRFCSIDKFYPFMNEEEKKMTLNEVKKTFEIAKCLADECDILILDEIFACCSLNLISKSELTEFIENKPTDLELVLTGRDAPGEIIEMADYVSEIKEIKHPYARGIKSRMGIEY